MPIAARILVAGTAAQCLSSAAGMIRFLARLSGRRRHVRRSSSGPGGGARAVEETEEAATTAAAVAAVAAAGVGGYTDCGLTDERRGGSYETVGASVLEEVSRSPVADGEVCCGDSSTNYSHRCHHLHRIHRRHSHRRHQQEECIHRCQERRDAVTSKELVVDERADDEASSQNQANTAPIPHRELRHEVHHLHRSHHRHLHHRHHHLNHHHHPYHHHHHHQLHQFHKPLRDDRQRNRNEGTVGRVVRTNYNYRRVYGTTVTNNPATVTAMTRGCRFHPYLALLILSSTFIGAADACSSRSTPKPRPPTPTPRPNITFHMYTCPPDYAEWYCLNGATCFTVKIVDSLLYNCLCANGYIGQRCEFKDLDGSYLPSRQRVMLETASIAGGATIAVFLVVIICVAAYIHCKRKKKERSSNCVDTVDGPGRDPELRPFSNRSRSLMMFMTKNPNSSATIEQTKMPGWNCSEAESVRMASINEGRRSNQ